MTDLLCYSAFALTILLALASFALARSSIGQGTPVRLSCRRFVLASIAAGLASGVVYFHGVLRVADAIGFHVDVGHGEVLVAAPLFNAVLGAILAAIGRVILLWEPIR